MVEMKAPSFRVGNFETAYRVLHEACTEAEGMLRDGGTFPIKGVTWQRLRDALSSCEEFLGKP